MLLKFALSALFVGAVLLLLAFRIAQRGASVHFESLVSSRERAILACSAASQDHRFAALAALQTEAYLELSQSGAFSDSEAELLGRAEALGARCDELIKALSKPEELPLAFGRFLKRQDALGHALTTPPWLGRPELSVDEQSPRELALPESASTQPLEDLDRSAVWAHLEDSAGRLQKGFWAAGRGPDPSPENQRLIERALSLLQAAGPWLAWRWAGLTEDRLQALAEHLRKSSEALAQLFYEVQILRRISKDSSDSELATELARSGLQLYAELPALARLGPTEHAAALQNWAEKASTLTQRSLDELAPKISPDWRMAEILYGHPRGAAVIAEFKMQCRGCSVLASEKLSSAALVHDVPLQDLLSRLKGEAS